MISVTTSSLSLYLTIRKKEKHQGPTDFSDANIQNFKLDLRTLTWQATLNSNSVDESYNHFWSDFKRTYDTHFPKVTRKTNKNKHKLCKFLTPELLAARRTKLELHKKYLASPTPENAASYKKQRNEYNSAIRKCKAIMNNLWLPAKTLKALGTS